MHTSTNNQQSAFDTVNRILNRSQSSNTLSQSQKLAQLQSLCQDLILSNRHLTQQIQFLKDQLDLKSNQSTQTAFNQDYSQMQLDFSEIQEYLKIYRTQLQKYQQKSNKKLKQKNELIKNLKEQIINLQKKLQNKINIIQQLSIQKQTFQETKNNLIEQIQQLQSSLKKYKIQSPRSYKNYNHNNNQYSNKNFNNNIQNQLQKLIQKLIKQLQYEKNIKKKLNIENKKLQENIVSLQKQIILKNNKIYQLQINAIKNIKYHSIDNKIIESKINKQQKKFSKIMKNFTFMQLINQQIEINPRQKLIIALKTIDFYLKKIENQDYISYYLQSIKICNYNQIHPNLIMIRASNIQHTQNDYDQTQAEVVWNLAFILDNLFNQCPDQNQIFGQLTQQRDIIDFLTQILENRGGSTTQTLLELRQMVEQAISYRK